MLSEPPASGEARVPLNSTDLVSGSKVRNAAGLGSPATGAPLKLGWMIPRSASLSGLASLNRTDALIRDFPASLSSEAVCSLVA